MTSPIKNLVSWNVNGLRAVVKKGFFDSVAFLKPDVLCLQEIKAMPDQIDFQLDGYHCYWNPAKRKGYSGTMLLTRQKPIEVKLGLADFIEDDEGRMITADYGDYYLVTVYTPNAKRDLSRLEYRQKWDRCFLDYLLFLEQKKPVIFCGDLNVAHQEIDLANPRSNRGNAGFTDEERQGIDSIYQAGFTDSFRHLTKEPGHYSWWSYMGRAREKNIGWRIDLFGLSQKLVNGLQKATIYPQIMGSDHCPVGIHLGL